MTVVPIFCAWASSHSKTRQDHEHKGQSWQTAVLTRPELRLWWEQVCVLTCSWGGAQASSLQEDKTLEVLLFAQAPCPGVWWWKYAKIVLALWEQLCTSGGHGCRTPSGIRPAWAPWGLTTGWRFLEAVGLVLIMNFGVKNLSVFSVFSWRIVELQCCINFFYTAKWLSYTYIYILFYIFFHYGLLNINWTCCYWI